MPGAANRPQSHTASYGRDYISYYFTDDYVVQKSFSFPVKHAMM